MPVYISLLRGINVGGNKRIKMADLRALYKTLGFTGTQTVLQSGNVAFKADRSDSERIARHIENGIEQEFGFQSRIIIRSYDQFKTALQQHPYTDEQLQKPRKLLIVFLQSALPEGAVETLRATYDGPESIQARGQELYLYYPNGMGRSKLTLALIEKTLQVTGTGRNWNTSHKLLDLATTLDDDAS